MIVADHQAVERTAAEAVPWSDKRLTLELATFRDKLEPGATETYRVVVRGPDGEPVGADAAELVASMYDRSLDFFQPHPVPQVSSLYPLWGAPAAVARRTWARPAGSGRGGRDWAEVSAGPSFRDDAFVAIDPYGIGGPGRGPMRYLAKGEDGDGRRGAGTRERSGAAGPSGGGEVAAGLQAPGSAGGRQEEMKRSVEPARRGRRAAALELRRDRVLAAAPDDRRRRLGGDRVPGARVADLVEALDRRLDPRPRFRNARAAGRDRQGADGAPLPAALPARGRRGRAQGRGPGRRQGTARGEGPPRDRRPGEQGRPLGGVRSAGGRRRGRLRRPPRRGDDAHLPGGHPARTAPGRLPGRGPRRCTLGRRAAAAAGPAFAHRAGAVPLRRPVGARAA